MNTWQKRSDELEAAHMKPLVSFVDGLRQKRSEAVPYPDPRDGGVNARVLLLLEAPGRRAVQSGFVSIDNPDGTARNLRAILDAAKLERGNLVLWNIIPWYIGSDSKIRPATRQDISEGLEHLNPFLELLPRLEAVVMMGRKAQRAAPFFTASRPELTLLETFHSSNQALTFDKSRRGHIVDALSKARALLEE